VRHKEIVAGLEAEMTANRELVLEKMTEQARTHDGIREAALGERARETRTHWLGCCALARCVM
jgi:hypothetical protein